ncbi:MAG: hypothetical protein ACOYKA_05305, partial [Legionellaceae bacterium]
MMLRFWLLRRNKKYRLSSIQLAASDWSLDKLQNTRMLMILALYLMDFNHQLHAFSITFNP